ncbi:hypothetical protein GCM10023210_43830 [Chryseobacterium ginsengisoli]|uniref:Uncharacterized protein n=1 Tax=Chryseobacterium ginsengisoli TaxID=363853 RepID=A0ABP9MW51_9FLAO
MIKKAYYYLFYKIYKSIEYTSEEFGGAFLTDFKTGLVIGALEIWLLFSIGNYYSIITKKNAELSLTMPIVYIPLVILLILNYFSFIHNDIWKEYNRKFDQLPKKKNIIGTWIVVGVIVFIIANLIYSFYLMSQIDWSLYR